MGCPTITSDLHGVRFVMETQHLADFCEVKTPANPTPEGRSSCSRYRVAPVPLVFLTQPVNLSFARPVSTRHLDRQRKYGLHTRLCAFKRLGDQGCSSGWASKAPCSGRSLTRAWRHRACGPKGFGSLAVGVSRTRLTVDFGSGPMLAIK